MGEGLPCRELLLGWTSSSRWSSRISASLSQPTTKSFIVSACNETVSSGGATFSMNEFQDQTETEQFAIVCLLMWFVAIHMCYECKTLLGLLRILTLSPCQGREPLLKYMRTYPRLSMSSRRDCSIPRCALIEAYLRRRVLMTAA